MGQAIALVLVRPKWERRKQQASDDPQDDQRDRQTSSTNSSSFMKCSCFVSLRILRMDGHLMICKTPSVTGRHHRPLVLSHLSFSSMPLALYSRTDIRSRIGGWRGTALAALFPPRTWRTGHACFQASGSPVPASRPVASPHFASPYQVQAVPLSPFVLYRAFLCSPAGRDSCGDSVPMRLAPLRGSHVPSQ